MVVSEVLRTEKSMVDNDRYAIGQQDFKTLRERDALYIDKTAFVEKIVTSKSQYLFLARPRRFGKSLFLSMLQYFFEGKRELFKGLYIDSSDWDWESYPVLHLDLNSDRYDTPDMLDEVLNTVFVQWERKYKVEVIADSYPQRFKNIVRSAHEITGKQVVILVDEYDKPLVGNIDKEDNFEHYRAKLAGIYSIFKSSAPHIRLVFLTGVSRFSKLSVFSDLNNINDITFDDAFADICGITEKELLDNFQDGIKLLAEESRMSYQETLQKLKQNYDGYRFARKGSDIYNPWSVLCCMQKSRIGTYWIVTGATTVVANALKGADIDIKQTLNANWELDDLAGLDLMNIDPTPLLYQAGYLTIDYYDFDTDTVRLKVPNEEVTKGLFKHLLPLYLKPERGTAKSILDGIINSVKRGKPEYLMKSLSAYFAGIPYNLKMDNENNFQNALYVLMTLIGIDVKSEVCTSDGRIDLLIETPHFIYIIELKYDASAEEALQQIDDKEYALMFSSDSRKVFRIGVSFSSRKRRIESWIIQ